MFSTKECKDFTLRQGQLRSASPVGRSHGPDSTVSIRAASGEVCNANTTKRKRHSASSKRGSQVHSVISNVGSPDNSKDVSAPDSVSVSEYWRVKGYAFPDYVEHDYSEESGDEERGRKRQRDTCI